MNPHPRLTWFIRAVVGMVVVVAVVGLYVAGTPGTERARKFDEQRLNNLMEIASVIDLYYSRKGVIPASLEELYTQSGNEYMIRTANDPVTSEPYRYEPVDSNDYRLCATFDQPTPEEKGLEPRAVPMYYDKGYPYARDWNHPSGDHCFTLTAVDQQFRTSCGTRVPCPVGQSCAVLPGENESFCVPEGRECIAAGCPGECTILESYPLQVSCPAAPDETAGTAECTLMRDPDSGKVDCFGCADGVCKDPAPGWERFTAPTEPGYVGIPYACFASGNGCELAQ